MGDEARNGKPSLRTRDHPRSSSLGSFLSRHDALVLAQSLSGCASPSQELRSQHLVSLHSSASRSLTWCLLVHTEHLTTALSWCPNRSRNVNTSPLACKYRSAKLSRTTVGPISSRVSPARLLNRTNSVITPCLVSACPISERKSGASLSSCCIAPALLSCRYLSTYTRTACTACCSSTRRLPFIWCCLTRSVPCSTSTFSSRTPHTMDFPQ